jgi:hypothetical protein
MRRVWGGEGYGEGEGEGYGEGVGVGAGYREVLRALELAKERSIQT